MTRRTFIGAITLAMTNINDASAHLSEVLPLTETMPLLFVGHRPRLRLDAVIRGEVPQVSNLHTPPSNIVPEFLFPEN